MWAVFGDDVVEVVGFVGVVELDYVWVVEISVDFDLGL